MSATTTTTTTTASTTIPTTVPPTGSPEYKGQFRYVTKNQTLEVNPNLYHLPPLSAFNDVLTLPVKDIGPSLALGDESPYKLLYHGFTARREPSRLHSAPYDHASWMDQDLIRDVYMPEVVAMVKRVTGCKSAIVESAVLRNNVHSEVDSHSKEHSGADFSAGDAGPCPRMIGFTSAGGTSPAPKVHLDFSPLGARTHIRKYHRNLTLAAEPVIQAENKLLKSGVGWNELKHHYHGPGEGEDGIPRFALFSIWRPLKPVRRDPLAMSSCASFHTSDYVAVDLVQPSGRNIPPHLSQIIDPTHSLERDSTQGHQEKAGQDEAPTHFSNSYLSYAPVDREGTGHDWHFIANQDPTEVLILQLFDSEMEAMSATQQKKEHGDAAPEYSISGVIHSAFELEGQDYDSEARESLEVRVVAFW